MSVQMAGRGGGRVLPTRRGPAERAAALQKKPLAPELAKFVSWSRKLVMDSGKNADWETWQLLFFADFFSGVRESWLVVPQSNGKTTMLAALALYHSQTVPSARVPMAASSSRQAGVLFDQAQGFVMRTPSLHDDFECLPGYKKITCERLGSEMQVYAADVQTADGVIPTLALVDELHRHKDMRLYMMLRDKTEKRGGQIITISTAGSPGHDFEVARASIREHPDAERKGCFTRVVTPELVFHEYSVPEAADVEDLRLVKEANPFSRITVASLERQRRSPTWDLDQWKRFTCNLATRGESAAISSAEWQNALSDKRVPKGEPIWLGVDLAFRWDTTALVPYWQPAKNSRYFGIPTILVPPRNGNQLSPEQIEAALRKIHERNPIGVVVMDPNKGESVAAFCKKEFGARVLERKRTPGNAEIEYMRFMEALRSGWLHHPGDPTFTQHVLNASAQMNPFGATRFDESHAARYENASTQDTRVIDALSAASMVHAAANEEPETDDRPKWRLLA